MLGAKYVGSSGRVVAVEPLPRNIDMIEKHLAINDVSNVQIVGKAISDFVGTAWFSIEGYSTSKLMSEGQTTVEVTTLDTLVEELGSTPEIVKVDIEGAEVDLLRGAIKTLAEFRSVVFLAARSEDIFDELLEIYPRLEHEVKELDGTDVIGSSGFYEEVVLMPAELRTGSTRIWCSESKKRIPVLCRNVA